MIINVVPRKFVKMFPPKDEFFKNNNFISIGEQEGYEGVSANGANILKLVFDDASPAETGCTLFSPEQARSIKKFVDTIDKTKALYVNCFAGISRSGAVGTVINDYVNCYLNDCKKNEDWDLFFQRNPQILPNAYVMRVMREEFWREQ